MRALLMIASLLATPAAMAGGVEYTHGEKAEKSLPAKTTKSCFAPGAEIEASGSVEKYEFEHAGNGELITAIVLKLDQPLCVVDESKTEENVETLQLLPEDFGTGHAFVPGDKISLKGKLDYPGDTAWYTSFYLLFYPASGR